MVVVGVLLVVVVVAAVAAVAVVVVAIVQEFSMLPTSWTRGLCFFNDETEALVGLRRRAPRGRRNFPGLQSGVVGVDFSKADSSEHTKAFDAEICRRQE